MRKPGEIGDIRSLKKGSASRKSVGKVSFAELPLHLLAGVARVIMGGKLKYAPYNWAKGMPWSECLNCTLRHLFKFWYLGQEIDPESGEHHVDHAICNLLFLRHYILAYKDGDDRPPKFADFASELGWFSTNFDAESYMARNGLSKKRRRRK